RPPGPGGVRTDGAAAGRPRPGRPGTAARARFHRRAGCHTPTRPRAASIRGNASAPISPESAPDPAGGLRQSDDGGNVTPRSKNATWSSLPRVGTLENVAQHLLRKRLRLFDTSRLPSAT